MKLKHRTAHLLIIALLLTLFAAPAQAESVVGKWSGKLLVGAVNTSARVTFTSGGRFKITAPHYQITSTGSYSYDDGIILLDSEMPYVYQSTMTVEMEKNRMVITGNVAGYDGVLTVRRTGGSGGSKKEAASTSPYGEWVDEKEERLLRIYRDGWIYWQETTKTLNATTREVAKTTEEFGGRLQLEKNRLIVTEAVNGLVPPASWEAQWDEAAGGWVLPYKLDEGILTLTLGESEWAFDKDGRVDDKPSEILLRAVVPLERGDQGEAVKSLQTQLIELGLLDGAPDGIFGKLTCEAVRAFQAQNALPEDGMANPAMLALLYPAEDIA